MVSPVRWMACGLAAAAGNVHAQNTIVGVGSLSTGQGSTITGVSASGGVVVGYALEADGGFPTQYEYHAFRWTSGSSITALGPVPGVSQNRTQPFGVSGNGSVIVGLAAFPTGFFAFSWTPSGGYANLGTIPGFSLNSGANAANADGSVIVGYSTRSTSQAPYGDAFLWTPSGMSSFGALGSATSAIAWGVSAAGDVIVGNNSAAFRWTLAQGTQQLPAPPGYPYTSAWGVSGNGAAVVGQARDPNYPTLQARPVEWVSGVPRVLNIRSQDWSGDAWATTMTGDIVVGVSLPLDSVPPALGRAMLWSDALGAVDLNDYLPTIGVNLSGWTLHSAVGISADGRVIVGIGDHVYAPGQSQPEGWVVSLADPPGGCYANCDGSSSPPILNVNDFQCFLNEFAAGDPRANCDLSAALPILNANDFQCFINRFAGGCP